MREKLIIENTSRMNTVESIVSELEKIYVEKGDILLVHSSLSALGWVCGGPQSVIIALKNAVGKSGTIVMPAHSGENSDPKNWINPQVPKSWIDEIQKNMPCFDVHLTQTRGMGKIAELFRGQPDTIRSNHPQTSFCAWGKYADLITTEHVLTPQFGIETPTGKMYSMNAKVLLLGVGYENNSCFHLAETYLSSMPSKTCGTSMMENGKRVWKVFDDFDYNSNGYFAEIGENFEKSGSVIKGKIGNGECRIFDLKTAVDFAYKWMEKNINKKTY